MAALSVSGGIEETISNDERRLECAVESTNMRAQWMEELLKSISIEHNILNAKRERAVQLYSPATQNAIQIPRGHLCNHREPNSDWQEYEQLNRIVDEKKKLDRKLA